MANKEQIEKLKDALKTKKKELGEVEEAWKTARGKLSKVLQRFKSLQEQNRAKKKELKAAKATIAELRAQAMFTADNDNNNNKDSDNNNNNDNNIDYDVAEYKKRISELESELSAMVEHAEHAGTKSINSEKENRILIEKLEEELRLSKIKEQELKEKGDAALQTQKTQANLELKKAIKKIKDESGNMEEKDDEIEWLKEELEQSQESLSDTRKALKEMKKINEEQKISMQNNDSRNEIETLQTELNNSKSSFKALKTELQELNGENDRLQEQMKKLSARKVAVIGEDNSDVVATYKSTIEKLKEQLDDAMAEAKDYENMADSRGELLAEYGREMQSTKEQMKGLEEKCKELEDINGSSDRDLIAKLSASEKTVQDLWAKYQSVDEQLRNENKAKGSEYDHLVEENDMLKKQLRKVSGDLEQERHKKSVVTPSKSGNTENNNGDKISNLHMELNGYKEKYEANSET